MLIASQYVTVLLGDNVETDNGNTTINAYNETDLDDFSNSTSSALDNDEVIISKDNAYNSLKHLSIRLHLSSYVYPSLHITGCLIPVRFIGQTGFIY